MSQDIIILSVKNTLSHDEVIKNLYEETGLKLYERRKYKSSCCNLKYCLCFKSLASTQIISDS